MLKFTKDLKGKQIALVGIGNTARVDEGEIRYATVAAVRQKSVSLLFDNTDRGVTLSRHQNQNDYGNWLTNGANRGYACYYSDTEILNERYAEAKLRKISDILSNYRILNPVDKLQAILNVISEEGGE